MGVCQQAGIFVDSFVAMEEGVPMRYEIDRHNDVVVLYCGHNSEYVLTLGRDNLTNLINLGTEAIRELTA
ncbi:hypothetical protein [Saccharopolyspora sp. NPDC002376]